ncbi:hypothetical protein COLO4_16120 [Corchorus olitorius]|uniref:Uncharacterized protein n=1 Tax=Corchorus olitorius TaxID=93759 RepID=A0A1R3JJE6_9ROSI|nr:hypothetical protein COLO4_16120 [Corchorus olitorius]
MIIISSYGKLQAESPITNSGLWSSVGQATAKDQAERIGRQQDVKETLLLKHVAERSGDSLDHGLVASKVYGFGPANGQSALDQCIPGIKPFSSRPGQHGAVNKVARGSATAGENLAISDKVGAIHEDADVSIGNAEAAGANYLVDDEYVGVDQGASGNNGFRSSTVVDIN